MLFVGVNKDCKNVTRVYVGVNKEPKEVTSVYVGESNSPKPVYHKNPIETVITSSGVMTVPAGVYRIKAFCVGGGAGGGSSHRAVDYYNDEEFTTIRTGDGGGGGYTKTEVLKVKPGDTINIVIGAGGNGGEECYNYDSDNGSRVYYTVDPTNGGASSVTIGSSTLSAEGGKTFDRNKSVIDGITYNGAHGGSGGGLGYYSGSYTYTREYNVSSKGGKDGSDGGSAYHKNGNISDYIRGGRGQHTTTRAFGEAEGTLYSQGGDGGDNSYPDGINGYRPGNNTGGGGSGTNYHSNESDLYIGGKGGSGMVLLKW